MGVSHTFRVDSDTARVLVLSTPAGLERMVRDGSVPAGAATLPPGKSQHYLHDTEQPGLAIRMRATQKRARRPLRAVPGD